MKSISVLVLMLVGSLSFASEYKVGNQAQYKYSQIFRDDSDYRYSKETVIDVKENGKVGLIESVETIGPNGPIVNKSQWWNDLRSFESYHCQKSGLIKVEAGTFNTCFDFLDAEGNGLYFSSDLKWLVRVRTKVCVTIDSQTECNSYNKDLISITE